MTSQAHEDRPPTRLSRRSVLLSGAVVASLAAGGVLAQLSSGDPRPQHPFTGERLPVASPPDPTDEPVEVVYCAGWDPLARAPVQPMSESVARAQHASGGQYAAVLFVGGMARAVVEVCWSAHHAEVWNIDSSGRRYRGVAYRRWPDGRLRLFEVRSWNYAGPDKREFDGDQPTLRARVQRAETAAVETVSVHAELPSGGKLTTSRDWGNWPEPVRPPDDVDVPPVSGWPALAGMTGPTTVRTGPDAVPATFPWSPPQPLRPRRIDQIVTDGARLRTEDGRLFTVQRVPAGTIRLPSGTLVVGDPGWIDAKTPPLTAKIPPGTYPVEVFQLTENGTRQTAACRVTVTDAAVTSWHLALRDGDHELNLGNGEFFGNPVDTATLALVDKAGATAYQEGEIEAASAAESAYRTLSAAETDMVIVPGWSDGSNPVWIGRTKEDAIGCFVLDLLLPELTTAEPA